MSALRNLCREWSQACSPERLSAFLSSIFYLVINFIHFVCCVCSVVIALLHRCTPGAGSATETTPPLNAEWTDGRSALQPSSGTQLNVDELSELWVLSEIAVSAL